jgi:hypothetical protein
LHVHAFRCVCVCVAPVRNSRCESPTCLLMCWVLPVCVCVCVCVYMPWHFCVYLLATVCVGQEVGGVSKCVCVHVRAHAWRAPPKVFYVLHIRM